MRPQAPCKGCEWRNATCHGTCEKYQVYVVKNAEWLKGKHERLKQTGNIMALENRRTARVRAALKKK